MSQLQGVARRPQPEVGTGERGHSLLRREDFVRQLHHHPAEDDPMPLVRSQLLGGETRGALHHHRSATGYPVLVEHLEVLWYQLQRQQGKVGPNHPLQAVSGQKPLRPEERDLSPATAVVGLQRLTPQLPLRPPEILPQRFHELWRLGQLPKNVA